MADSAVQFEHCVAQLDLLERPLDDADPFTALRFHFGMLLGVADFDAGQAYHRGKMRLHNAWLHGAGVVWGFDVNADIKAGEIRVESGLLLDEAGHELHLDGAACVNVGSWYQLHQNDAGVKAVVKPVAAGVIFDAHVVARFRACLTREVPALAEPCEGVGTDTAFSRVSETIELELRPGLPDPAAATSFERLRVFLGLQPPLLKVDGTMLPASQDAMKARSRFAALSNAERAALVRQLLALDTSALSPYTDPSGQGSRYPADDRPAVLLATVAGIQLKTDGQLPVLLGVDTVRTSVRRTLLPTSVLQDLLFPLLPALVDAGGPRFKMDRPADSSITLTADKTIDAITVVDDAFTVTSRADATAKWTPRAAKSKLEPDKKTVTLTLVGAPFGAKEIVRVIAYGTGPTPILGVDGVPLAGRLTDPPSAAHDGRDFVDMLARS